MCGSGTVRRLSVGKAICHSVPPVPCLGTEKITCNPVLKSVTLVFMSVHTGLGSQRGVTYANATRECQT